MKGITVDEMTAAERLAAVKAYDAIHDLKFDMAFAPNRAWAEGWVMANRSFIVERAAAVVAATTLKQAAEILDEVGDMLEAAGKRNPRLLDEIPGFRYPMADECGGLASMCRDAEKALDGEVKSNG